MHHDSPGKNGGVDENFQSKPLKQPLHFDILSNRAIPHMIQATLDHRTHAPTS